MARHYEIDGKLYPSVTTALSIIRKPALEIWRGNLGNEEADRLMYEAADLGSEIHEYCHMINTGAGPLTIQKELAPMLDAYRQWFRATIKEVIFAEQLVVSHKYQYAGTFDLLAILKGDKQPATIDLKTSKDVYPDMALQLAAYQQGLKEAGIKSNRRLIVHLDKITKGKIKTKEYRDHARDLNMFLYALELYRYFEGGKLNARTSIVKTG